MKAATILLPSISSGAAAAAVVVMTTTTLLLLPFAANGFLHPTTLPRTFIPSSFSTPTATAMQRSSRSSNRLSQQHPPLTSSTKLYNVAPGTPVEGSNNNNNEKVGGPPPIDNASTLAQFMTAMWRLIAYASKNMERGDSHTMTFPKMAPRLSNPDFISKLLAHLDTCKDVCDNFGVNTVLIPYPSASNVQGFTVKSYRNPASMSGILNLADGSVNFTPDRFWDEEEEWDFSGIDDDMPSDQFPQIETLVPKDDATIVDLSQKWVDKMMADLALCPFTQSASKSGIPLGPVRYHVDRVQSFEDAYMVYWNEVCRIEAVPQDEISTTLQILPEFCMDSCEMFEQWADTLTGTLETFGIEELLQLIFFHPTWTFRDGWDRGDGEGMAANYARRSPWPMVNILRTKQVRVAQRGIPTGLVYQQNEKTLSEIGTDKLEEMLRLRDWSEVSGMKVDRKDMEALRVANDLQVTGVIKDEDKSFAYDSTPKANKVDRSSVEEGNMAYVIQQALEIRLGKHDAATSSGGSPLSPLNGAQTSAALMASDYLLEELDRIAEEYPNDQRAPSSSVKAGGYASAYGFDVVDYDEEDVNADEEAEMAALWGGGIPMSSEE